MRKEHPLVFRRFKFEGVSSIRTAYEVYRGAKKIGYVFSRVGSSYRGMEGWNRGIRLKDFHPIEWGCAEKRDGVFEASFFYHNRRIAAEQLGEVRWQRN